MVSRRGPGNAAAGVRARGRPRGFSRSQARAGTGRRRSSSCTAALITPQVMVLGPSSISPATSLTVAFRPVMGKSQEPPRNGASARAGLRGVDSAAPHPGTTYALRPKASATAVAAAHPGNARIQGASGGVDRLLVHLPGSRREVALPALPGWSGRSRNRLAAPPAWEKFYGAGPGPSSRARTR